MFENLTIRKKLLYGFISISLIAMLSSSFAISFLVKIKKNNEEIGIKLAPLGDAIMELKLTATKAHLVFEEVMAGDKSENIQEVWDLLDETLWYCDAILSGGTNDKSTFYKTENDEIRRRIEKVKKQVEEFIKSAKNRHSALNISGAGSDVDQVFDKQYDEIQDVLKDLSNQNKSNSSILYMLGESKYLLANGHLFLEERLSGDLSVDFDEVLDNFEEAQQYIKNLKTGFNNVEKTKLEKAVKKLIKLVKVRNQQATQVASVGGLSETNFDNLFEAFLEEADYAENFIHNHINENISEVRANIAVSIFFMVLISIFTLLLSIYLSILFSKSILKSINKATSHINLVSKGDLTMEVEMKMDSKDEISNMLSDFTRMVSTIHGVMTNIISGAKNISEATHGISSTSQVMAQGANEQASSIEEISSSTEELTANIQQNTENAQETEKIATHASQEIMKGSLSVKETTEAMQMISEKIGVISEIAFQTNILALNAAVEAARAGEHGKGFAVVASEVRSLAVRSQVAAKQINEITRKSVEIAENTDSLFTEIVPLIQKTSSLVQEISAASREQSNGINQISLAIQTLNSVTQQNAASSEELASSSQEIASQSESLVESISYFKVRKEIININSKSYEKPPSSKLEEKFSGANINMSDDLDNDFTVF